MDRRDFFGVIAAPMLRQFVPPMPVAGNAADRLRVESYRMSDLPMVLGVHVDIKSHFGGSQREIAELAAAIMAEVKRSSVRFTAMK